MGKKIVLLVMGVCILAVVNICFADVNSCGEWGHSEMDFNKDCYVDMMDFTMFSKQWITCSDPLNDNCIKLNKTILIAHRGYSSIAPENTLSAFYACDDYADMVEFDVHSSLDEVLVVIHDNTVDRTTDGNGPVNSFTLDQLKELDAGSWFDANFSEEKIPTLQEAIEAILPTMTPCIERKTGSAQQYINLLETMGVIDDVVIISFSESFLNDVRNLNQNIKLGFLSGVEIDDSTIVRLRVNNINIADWNYGVVDSNDIKKIKSVGLGGCVHLTV